MILIILCVLGFGTYGGLLARKRGGKGADIAQYAAGFAFLGAIIGMFLTIVVSRFLLG